MVDDRRVIAITGIPGAGKTTLAKTVGAVLGYPVISTGDISRRVDPDGLAAGAMADEALLRRAFQQTLEDADWSTPNIVDGLPRSREQVALLPYFTRIVNLTCRPDIARDRLLRRGREDDTPDIVARRIEEQSELLDIKHADGWLYALAGWGWSVNTSYKSPEQVAEGVLAALTGKKMQAF